MHVLIGESLGQLGVSSVEYLTAASLSIGPTFLASSTNNHHDQNRDWQPLSKPKKWKNPSQLSTLSSICWQLFEKFPAMYTRVVLESSSSSRSTGT